MNRHYLFDMCSATIKFEWLKEAITIAPNLLAASAGIVRQWHRLSLLNSFHHAANRPHDICGCHEPQGVLRGKLVRMLPRVGTKSICLWLYNGSNNGRIALSVRMAAQRCRTAKDTAARAFSDLQERGFIECVTPGAFSLKKRHATEWRLTHVSCNVIGALPSKLFMRWHQEKQSTLVWDTYSLLVGGAGPTNSISRRTDRGRSSERR